jgi:hypothetical protein
VLEHTLYFDTVGAARAAGIALSQTTLDCCHVRVHSTGEFPSLSFATTYELDGATQIALENRVQSICGEFNRMPPRGAVFGAIPLVRSRGWMTEQDRRMAAVFAGQRSAASDQRRGLTCHMGGMKIRQLKAILRHRGYHCRRGHGSHSVWTHPLMPHRPIVLARRDGEDAPHYIVRRVLGRRRKRGAG